MVEAPVDVLGDLLDVLVRVDETSQRVCAIGSASFASRSISRGSWTPVFLSPDSASAAQTLVSSIARAWSGSKLTFISIMRSIAPASRPAFSAPSASAGSSVSVYSSSPLPLVQMNPSPIRPASRAAAGPEAAM